MGSASLPTLPDGTPDILADEQPKLADIADWFSVQSWRRTVPRSEVPALERSDAAHWLLFADRIGVGYALAVRLQAAGQRVTTVTPGPEFKAAGPGAYQLRPGERGDYLALLQELARAGAAPTRLLHAWAVELGAEAELAARLPAALERGFYSLLALAQALGDQGLDSLPLTVLARGLHDVLPGDPIFPEQATLIGPCKVIPQEYDRIRTRCIDLALPSDQSEQAAFSLDALLAELLAEREEPILALRGEHCWAQRFEPSRIRPLSHKPALLRDGGVYLITGGLGGIGLALAAHLAQHYRARLVLLGRSPLPPQEQWPTLLARPDLPAPLASRLRQLQALHDAGAQLLVCAADVADPAQLAAVRAQLLARFGTLHGIFHAAAAPPRGLIQHKLPAQAARVLAPKLHGTLALAACFADLPLDFSLLFASISAATGGGPGQVDYCAANAFLEAYARSRPRQLGRTLALSWGEWQWDAWAEGLSGFPEEAQQYFVAKRAAFGIPFAAGLEALERALGRGLPQLYVTTQPFDAMVSGSRQFSVTTILAQVRKYRQLRPLHPRPAVGASYRVPQAGLEAQLAAVWQELLGIEAVGAEDNFFELGGNSLLGIDLVQRLRAVLGLAQLPAHILYEAPTIADLAALLAAEAAPAAPAEDWQGRSTKRSDSLKSFKRKARTEA